MPQPNTHFIVIEQALSDLIPDLWEKYSNYAGLGSYVPFDLFYTLGKAHFFKLFKEDYSIVSDVMHWEGSLDLFANMLDNIKASKNDKNYDENKINKLKAFAYGVYSHAVVDAVFHPFVYCSSDDHWHKHPTIGYGSHKRLESLIDGYGLGSRRGKNPYTFEFEKKVECHLQGSNRTLDEDVYKLIKSSLEKTYGGNIFNEHNINFHQYFGKYALTQPNPIFDGYRDFIGIFRTLYATGRKVRIPRLLSPLAPTSVLKAEELSEIIPKPREKWIRNNIDDMPDYDVDQLFEMAVNSIKKIISASEQFFTSNETSSRKFFAKDAKGIAYLDENYNLDTGLPASLNEHLITLATTEDVYRFGIGALNQVYKRINTQSST